MDLIRIATAVADGQNRIIGVPAAIKTWSSGSGNGNMAPVGPVAARAR